MVKNKISKSRTIKAVVHLIANFLLVKFLWMLVQAN